jgi:CBS domain containing-hemolysin-like protein
MPKMLRATSVALVAACALSCTTAHASFLSGETLDKAADVLAIAILVIVPIIAIVVFWLVHVLPERFAEQRHHPQAKAIQVLCLLSLFFGGLLWPLAWLWAYSKPVMYKLAYGTDVADHEHDDAATTGTALDERGAAHEEMARLRERLAVLESQASQEARG